MTIVEQGGGPTPQAAPDLIKETTTQTFVKDVIEESKRQPVLIDFWAPWCGPCRQLTPMLEKAVRAAKGKVKLVKMNIDEHPAIPGQMGIQSIPAVIAFVNGQPADGFMGAVPESQVNAFIEKLTKGVPAAGEPNIAEILQEAEAVLAEGDRRRLPRRSMPRCWRSIPPISPPWRDWRNATSPRARSNRPSRRSPWCRNPSATTPPSRRCRPRSISPSRRNRSGRSPSWNRKSPQTRSIIRRDSIWRPRSMPPASALKRPSSCCEIVKRDRKWNDDGARKQLIQFFEAWGGADEATVEGRKRLSTILFLGL